MTETSPLNHVIEPSEAVEVGAKLKALLEEGDEAFLPRLLEAQQRAESEFDRRGYAAWPLFPRHPLAPGLLAFDRWHTNPSSGIPLEIHPLIETAYLIESFRSDWEGAKAQFAADLRSENKSIPLVFELTVGHQLKLAGHDVKYMFPQDAGSFDLLVNGTEEVEVECKLTSSEARRAVPNQVAMEIAAQILPYMQRKQLHRLVLERLAALEENAGVKVIP